MEDTIGIDGSRATNPMEIEDVRIQDEIFNEHASIIQHNDPSTLFFLEFMGVLWPQRHNHILRILGIIWVTHVRLAYAAGIVFSVWLFVFQIQEYCKGSINEGVDALTYTLQFFSTLPIILHWLKYLYANNTTALISFRQSPKLLRKMYLFFIIGLMLQCANWVVVLAYSSLFSLTFGVIDTPIFYALLYADTLAVFLILIDINRCRDIFRKNTALAEKCELTFKIFNDSRAEITMIAKSTQCSVAVFIIIAAWNTGILFLEIFKSTSTIQTIATLLQLLKEPIAVLLIVNDVVSVNEAGIVLTKQLADNFMWPENLEKDRNMIVLSSILTPVSFKLFGLRLYQSTLVFSVLTPLMSIVGFIYKIYELRNVDI